MTTVYRNTLIKHTQGQLPLYIILYKKVQFCSAKMIRIVVSNVPVFVPLLYSYSQFLRTKMDFVVF